MPEVIKLYLKDIKDIQLLTVTEEKELTNRIWKNPHDEAARTKMIRSNLRLVINIAKKYSRYGVAMMDLIEEGNIGLIKAVSKFDPGKGYRFSTYAAWWIKQYVTRAIANQGKTIRIPVYMTELISRYKKTTEHLTQKFGRRPRIKEIAKEMKVPMKKLREISYIGKRTSSLDAPLSADTTSEFIDILEDENTPSPVEELSLFLEREHIAQLLSQLDEREQRILSLRFGLEDGTTHTLGEAAQIFGITRERVRQIENVAIIKLREAFLNEGEGTRRARKIIKTRRTRRKTHRKN